LGAYWGARLFIVDGFEVEWCMVGSYQNETCYRTGLGFRHIGRPIIIYKLKKEFGEAEEMFWPI
jgi:hypothetical protein